VVLSSDFSRLKELTLPRFQEDEEPELQGISVPLGAMLPEPPPFESAVNENDLAALEDRVLRAVEMMKHERQCRLAAEEWVSRLEAEKVEQAPRIESLERELRALRNERNQAVSACSACLLSSIRFPLAENGVSFWPLPSKGHPVQ